MDAFFGLAKLVNRESKYKDEAGGQLLLIRVMLLMWVPYYVINAIYCFIKGFNNYALTFLAGAAIYGIIMFYSYEWRPKICLLLMTIVSIFVSGYVTIGFGWRCSYQNLIYVVFFMLWYDSATAVKEKVLYSFMVTIAFFVISALAPFGKSLIEGGSLEFTVVVYINMIVFFISLSMVAYFMCTKYVEAEHKMREYNKQLKQMSETDHLTKLVNRRYATAEIREIEKESKEQNYMFCIAIGDIDFFKKINDTYGHDGGDFILASLAEMFKEHMEGHGFVARWGGEEFLFVIKRKNGDEAQILLDQLRHKVKYHEFDFNGQSIRVTMTFGVDEYSTSLGSEKTIESADKKLYLGKQGGRDQVVW